MHDWKDAGRIAFSKDNPYWKKLLEITDAFLEIGKGRFYTGLTDFHSGGDAIAALRDPLNFNLDMIDAVDDVKRLLSRVDDIYLGVFDECWARLKAARQACTSWPGIVSS